MPLFFFFMSFSDKAILKIRFGGVINEIFKSNIKSIRLKLVTRNLLFKNPVRVKFASLIRCPLHKNLRHIGALLLQLRCNVMQILNEE